MRKRPKSKLIVIVGPTASGKSDLAVYLAKKFNGEVISADSRQVYKGLNIGSGKITKSEMRGVRHHLLDVMDPKGIFTAADFKNHAQKAIDDITQRNKLPIIAGGTGFYIDTLTYNLSLPDVPPDMKLREHLEKQSTDKLLQTLIRLDPNRAQTIDPQNRRRLIRAIEIAKTLGSVPKQRRKQYYETLWIGITPTDLESKIHTRLLKRLEMGMIAEVKKLHRKGVSWKRMEALGLEYRYISRYLRNKLTKDEMTEILSGEIKKYAKRQMTWFRKNKETRWFTPNEVKEVEKEVEQFLS